MSASDKKPHLEIDEILLNACLRCTTEAYAVANVKPVPVGASRFISATEEVSVLVSLVGVHTGSVFLNLSRRAACFIAGRMLEEEFKDLTADVFDSIGEMGNIVAGRFKDYLLGTVYAVDAISLPAVILGANYNLYHSRGLLTASATFELVDMPIEAMREKFITTSVTLMRR